MSETTTMLNRATYSMMPRSSTASLLYVVQVNGVEVYRTSDEDRAKAMVARLNHIFRDKDRDLDCLTPTAFRTAGREDRNETGPVRYGICCPLVRRSHGVTHLLQERRIDRKLYETTNWQDSFDLNQTAILEFDGSDGTPPWVQAVTVANRIRDAVKLQFPDALRSIRPNPLSEIGVSKASLLHDPANRSARVEKLISHPTKHAYCTVYGHPCQGLVAGTSNPFCQELNFRPRNLGNPQTMYEVPGRRAEVLHTQDLICAMSTREKVTGRNWYHAYKNRYVRVTNVRNSLSVVVRVICSAGPHTSVDLSHRAWKVIGSPNGHGTVKVELLAE